MSEPRAATPPTRPRRARLVRWAGLALLGYGGVVVVLMFLENALLFHPVPAASDWNPPPISKIQDVEFRTADGTPIHAWWYPRAGSASALLYAHGNAGNLSHRGPALLPLSEALGVSVLIFDYPGYGRSGGRPTEQSCYAAGAAAYDWLTQEQRVAPANILLYGKSLGGGVATELARQRPHRALILVKTFTSVPDMAGELYPWLPARWLVRNRFDNLSKIGHCPRPVFIAHGDCDGLIPLRQAQRLFAAAHEPRRFLTMPGCDHNDTLPPEFYSSLREFLDRYAPVADSSGP